MTQAAKAPSVLDLSQALATVKNVAKKPQQGQKDFQARQVQTPVRRFSDEDLRGPKSVHAPVVKQTSQAPKQDTAALRTLVQLRKITPIEILDAASTQEPEQVFAAMQDLKESSPNVLNQYFNDVSKVLGVKIDSNDVSKMLASDKMPADFAKAFGLAIKDPIAYINDAKKSAQVAEATEAKDQSPVRRAKEVSEPRFVSARAPITETPSRAKAQLLAT